MFAGEQLQCQQMDKEFEKLDLQTCTKIFFILFLGNVVSVLELQISQVHKTSFFMNHDTKIHVRTQWTPKSVLQPAKQVKDSLKVPRS